MLDILFFISSIWGYILIEKFYKLGILVSAINVLANTIYRGRIASMVSVLIVLTQCFFLYSEKSNLAYFVFLALATVFPFSGKLGKKTKSKPPQMHISPENQNNDENAEVAEDIDIVQKAKDSARKREIERRRLAKERALTSPVKGPYINDTHGC